MTTTEALDELIAYAPEISISVEESHRYYYQGEKSSIDYTIAIHIPKCEIWRGEDLEILVGQAMSYISAARIEQKLTGICKLESPSF